MTKLDRLNELLKGENVPEFRKTVSPSMNNIKWLRGVLLNKTGNAELNELLALDPKSLLANHVNA